MVEYKLKRKYVKPQRFSCVGCNSSFSRQKELNEHFHTSHPPVKCDICEKFFDTLRHCCATSINIMNTCMNVRHAPMVSILPVNYRNINGFIKHKVTGSILNPSAGRDLSVSLSLMLIYYHTIKKNYNATSVPTKTLM